jgi:hypothetical protein
LSRRRHGVGLQDHGWRGDLLDLLIPLGDSTFGIRRDSDGLGLRVVGADSGGRLLTGPAAPAATTSPSHGKLSARITFADFGVAVFKRSLIIDCGRPLAGNHLVGALIV